MALLAPWQGYRVGQWEFRQEDERNRSQCIKGEEEDSAYIRSGISMEKITMIV